MELIVSLIMVPCVAALLMLVVRADKARDVLCVASAAVIALLSIAFAVQNLGAGSLYFDLPMEYSHFLAVVNIVIDITVGLYIVCYSVKYRRVLPLVLAIGQILTTLWFEYNIQREVQFESQMHIDSLSVIMVLIIGIVGTGICVYALGYMKDFQAHHPEQKDRRPWFFALMFAFLSAMYNVVLSDNLCWIYTAWEVTTLCSFLLIGFTKTEEAINNAFRQIVMNMLGGLAFQAAILWLGLQGESRLFSVFLDTAANTAVANPAAAGVFVLPVALLAFAGMTKAAQMPFHTWLLGAMVAPTPTSALLHSSTMVKAGCFLLIKLSPLFLVFPVASAMVVLIGGLTFCLASFMAISQSNAKRVLAYSTIANLGLIVACAGVGTPEAVWAAIFLVIFHAVAKSLLFLCVGTAEHHIGSRDIEDMDGLFERMPRLARFMMLGIMAMFVAPFGMLVSKWATLASFASSGEVLLLVLLAFGSAATFMFWGKWLGKLAGIAAHEQNVELSVHTSEWFALALMAVLTAGACICMPTLSNLFVQPFLVVTYGALGANISVDNMYIMSIIALAVVVMLFGTLGMSKLKKKKTVPVYMAGITANSDERLFRGSLGGEVKATSRNWYMNEFFGEKVLDNVSFIVRRGDKIAFISDNELAMTTLFQILMGEMKPDEGSFKWGVTTSQSYFPKDNNEFFEGHEENMLDWIAPYSRTDTLESTLRGFLGRMLFSGDDVYKPVRVLSGGEKVRLMLARMMLFGSNVLVIDQPTNHLDLESITAVNNGVRDFKGTVLFASHDHEFVQTIATRIIEIREKGVLDKECTYDEFLEFRETYKG